MIFQKNCLRSEDTPELGPRILLLRVLAVILIALRFSNFVVELRRWAIEVDGCAA
jgi:hypothetical protein